MIPTPGQVFTVNIDAPAFEKLIGQFPTRDAVERLNADQLEIVRTALKAALENTHFGLSNNIISVTQADLR